MKFGIRGQLTDIIKCVKFLVDQFRGYGVLTPQNCPLPSTCCVALQQRTYVSCHSSGNALDDFYILLIQKIHDNVIKIDEMHVVTVNLTRDPRSRPN